MIRRSASDSSRLCRSGPATSRSIASSRSCSPIAVSSRRVASSAASLTRFSRSAPVKPGRAPCEDGQVDVGPERDATRVHLQHREPAVDVGTVDHDLAVEPSGTQERRIEDVRAVRRRQHDHAARGVEAVHLHQELVERLLTFVVPTADAGTPLPPDRVELVDEDDRGRRVLRVLEQLAHTRRRRRRRTSRRSPTPTARRTGRPLRPRPPREQRLAGARRSGRAARPSGSARRHARNRAGSTRKSRISLSSSTASGSPATSAKVTDGRLTGRVLRPNSSSPRPPCAWRSRITTSTMMNDERQEREQHRHEPVLVLRVHRELRDLRLRDLARDLVGRLLGELHAEVAAVRQRPVQLVIAVEERDLGDRAGGEPCGEPVQPELGRRARRTARAAPPAARRRRPPAAPMPSTRRRSLIAALRPGGYPARRIPFDRFARFVRSNRGERIRERGTRRCGRGCGTAPTASRP